MVAQDIIAVAVETENRSKSKLLSSIFGVEKVAGAPHNDTFLQDG
jgi:hypothetical protein